MHGCGYALSFQQWNLGAMPLLRRKKEEENKRNKKNKKKKVGEVDAQFRKTNERARYYTGRRRIVSQNKKIARNRLQLQRVNSSTKPSKQAPENWCQHMAVLSLLQIFSPCKTRWVEMSQAKGTNTIVVVVGRVVLISSRTIARPWPGSSPFRKNIARPCICSREENQLKEWTEILCRFGGSLAVSRTS